MNLMEIVHDVIIELKKQNRYNPKNFGEENLYDSYILLAELLNPSNSYQYEKDIKGVWKYEDISGNMFYARLVYQPVSNPYFEVKTWWVDEHGKRQYDNLPNSVTAKDWDKRSDTVAKIFRDEMIPMFEKQKLSNRMIFKPVTESRYYFSLRMIKKFIPKEWKIIENFPKEIVVEKE